MSFNAVFPSIGIFLHYLQLSQYNFIWLWPTGLNINSMAPQLDNKPSLHINKVMLINVDDTFPVFCILIYPANCFPDYLKQRMKLHVSNRSLLSSNQRFSSGCWFHVDILRASACLMWILDNVDWGLPFLLSLSVWLSPPKHAGLSWVNVLWSHQSPHASHADGVARQPCLVTQQPRNPTEDVDFMGSVMSECRYSTHAGRFKILLQICMSNIKCISIKLYLLVQCRWCVLCVFFSPAPQQLKLILYCRQNNVEAPGSI